MLTIRIESGVRERIEQAARALGKSVSAFVLEAAVKAAERVQSRDESPKPTRLNSVPPFFRALCETASAGGGHSYVLAGEELAHHVDCGVIAEEHVGNWKQVKGDLLEAARKYDRQAVLRWFDEHCSACMELVPSRRRDGFVDGVVKYASEHWRKGR
jgi:hypothetical protein